MIIGGISLYRSFAMYEEKKTFDVLKGTVPDFKSDIKLAITLDGEPTEDIPQQEDGKYYSVEVTCDNGAEGKWNYSKWNVEVSNFKKGTKCEGAFQTSEEEIPGISDSAFIVVASASADLAIWAGSRYIAINLVDSKYFTISSDKTILTVAKDCKIRVYLFGAVNGKVNENQHNSYAKLYIDNSLAQSSGSYSVYEQEVKSGQTIRFYAEDANTNYYSQVHFLLSVEQ